MKVISSMKDIESLTPTTEAQTTPHTTRSLIYCLLSLKTLIISLKIREKLSTIDFLFLFSFLPSSGFIWTVSSVNSVSIPSHNTTISPSLLSSLSLLNNFFNIIIGSLVFSISCMVSCPIKSEYFLI